MRDRVNALGFALAESIHSGTGHTMAPHERNLACREFEDGEIQVMCAVDIFNEGIDVPDVNIVVFQTSDAQPQDFCPAAGTWSAAQPEEGQGSRTGLRERHTPLRGWA